MEIAHEAEEVTGIEFNTHGKTWVEGTVYSTKIKELGISPPGECYYIHTKKERSLYLAGQ